MTAAGYQDKPGRYEQRLSGLLRAFKASQLPADVVQGFWVRWPHPVAMGCYFVRVRHECAMPDFPKPHPERPTPLAQSCIRCLIFTRALFAIQVLGGECNFLFQCEAQYTLRALPAEEYMLYETYLGIYMREIHERYSCGGSKSLTLIIAAADMYV